MNFQKHLIDSRESVRSALVALEQLSTDAVLFVVDERRRLLGALTDGDIRRAIINGCDFHDPLTAFARPNPWVLRQGLDQLDEIIALRKRNVEIFPVINESGEVINVVNLRMRKSYLPVDALILAGGRGERLRPLTDTHPKPMLPVGDKPIIEYAIDRLKEYGIDDVWIALRYLPDQITGFLKDGSEKGIRIQYIHENEPLGTAGALSMVNEFVHDTVLMMNSDLLTNIDFEDFYLFFKNNGPDMAVACIPYQVNIPYAVMETADNYIRGFREKPTYTHYSNAGIYLMRKEVAEKVPHNQAFDATSLMEQLIREGKSVMSYPLIGYWLDIGSHDDYRKAQQEYARIKW